METSELKPVEVEVTYELGGLAAGSMFSYNETIFLVINHLSPRTFEVFNTKNLRKTLFSNSPLKNVTIEGNYKAFLSRTKLIHSAGRVPYNCDRYL